MGKQKKASHARSASAARPNAHKDEEPCPAPAEAVEHPLGSSPVRGNPSDAFDVFCTPIRHKGGRSSRAAAAQGLLADVQADQALISQQQTPERTRGAGLAHWLSPLPNFGSPGLFSSPNPVPLFHPSPKRTGLQSPVQHSGVNSFGNIFQSPERRADLHGSDLLRFETPSSKPRFDSLLSPSPRRSRRLASSGQQRKRAVSLEAVGWQLGLAGRPGDALGEAQPFDHGNEDAEYDLAKDLLQSPGPKEVQQLMPDGRPQTRSRSTLASPQHLVAAAAAVSSPAEHDLQAAAAAAAAATDLKPPAHSRRRALDFSKADTMHQDLHAMPLRRSHRHGSHHSGRSMTSAATAEAVEHGDAAGQQHHDQEEQQPHMSAQLPLLPLDLSECEKHLPGSSGITPRRSRRHQQQQLGGLTSPRTALDAAAAVVAGDAMQVLLANPGLLTLGLQDGSKGALRSMPAAAFGSVRHTARSNAAAAAAADDSDVGLPAMVPLDAATGTAAAAAAAATVVGLQRRPRDMLPQQLAAGSDNDRLVQVQEDYIVGDDSDAEKLATIGTTAPPAAQEEATEQEASEGEQKQEPVQPEASEQEVSDQEDAGSSGSRRWNLRQHSKYQHYADMQPSRRSRRIAGAVPEPSPPAAATAAASPTAAELTNPGSSSRRRRTVSRLSAQQHQEMEEHEQYLQRQKQHHDKEHDREQQQQPRRRQRKQSEDHEQEQATDADQHTEQQIEEGDDMTDTAAAAEEEEEEDNVESDRPRSKNGGKRCKKGSSKAKAGNKSSSSQQQPQQQQCNPLEGDYAAAGLDSETRPMQQQYLAALSGLQLLQSGTAGLQLAADGVPFAGLSLPTPDSNSRQLAGGSSANRLLVPGTPDDVRLAHVSGPRALMPMRTCHCKKSQCLKLYCDCFASGAFCNGCACVDCKNLESNTQEVIGRRNFIQQRDPNAFTNKLAQVADSLTNRKGCKCKKSHCLKKYCECFQMGVRCGEICKCSDCHNQEVEGSLPLPKQLLQHSASLQRSSSSSMGPRLQHPQFWPMPAASSAAAAAAAAAGQTIVLRLPGGPATPGAASMLYSLSMQSPAQGAAGAAAAAAAMQAVGHMLTPAGSGSLASTPNPSSKSAGLMHNGDSLTMTAKPLLPQFMQAAAAATAADDDAAAVAAALAQLQQLQNLHQQEDVKPSQLMAAAAARAAVAAAAGEDGACLLADEELPTPDQMAIDHHHMSSPMGEPSSELGDAAATAAAAAAASVVSSRLRRQRSGACVSPSRLQHHLNATSPCSPQAAASSSSGGEGCRAGGLSSVSSRGRHRLASTSRASDEPRQHHLHQQQQQQPHGLLALVPSAAGGSGAAAARCQQQQQLGSVHASSGVTTRRQLLRQVQEEDASTSVWARPKASKQQLQQQQPASSAGRNEAATADASKAASKEAARQLQQQHEYEDEEDGATSPARSLQATAANPAAAVAGDDVQETGASDAAAATQANSPVQPVILGPNGPVLVLPQRAVQTAMSQIAALVNTPTAAAAAAAADALEGGGKVLEGIFLHVVDDNGQMQQYFLPKSSQEANDAAGAADVGAPAVAAPVHELPSAGIAVSVDQPATGNAQAPAAEEAECAAEPMEDVKQALKHQQPQPHYQLRQRHNNSQQGPGSVQIPDADAMAVDQPSSSKRPLKAQREQQQQQQQEAADEAAAGAASVSRARNPRSQGSTPVKRATPVKRKADQDDDEGDDTCHSPSRIQPSPAKLQHQLPSPDHHQLQQQLAGSAARQVVLSPVKLRPAVAVLGRDQLQKREQQQSQEQQKHISTFNSPRVGRRERTAAAAAMAAPSCQQRLFGSVPDPGKHQRSSRRSSRHASADQARQEEQDEDLPVQQKQQQQHFYMTSTANGQQLLVQLSPGADSSALLAADSSLDSSCMAAVLAPTPLGWAQYAADASAAAHHLPVPHLAAAFAADGVVCTPGAVAAPALMLQPPQQGRMAGGHKQQQLLDGVSLNSPTGALRRSDLFGSTSPQPKMMLSPRETRTRDGSLFKVSPGCTTVFSPNKPLLGTSPTKRADS